MLSHHAASARLMEHLPVARAPPVATGGSIFDLSFFAVNFWDAFADCQFPIHLWLLVSAVSIYMLRAVHHLGKQSESTQQEGVSFLLNVRQEGFSKLVFRFTWLVATPFFVIWTMVGTYWLAQTMEHTPQCMPDGGHTWLVFIWQFLSYAWIITHAVICRRAIVLEGRLRRAESNLRQLGDADTIARWGEEFHRLPGVSSLSTLGGLSPEELGDLPGAGEWSSEEEECDCPICLAGFNAGDKTRTLHTCEHTFHRSCIDLWLLRRADCPLCKQIVSAGAN